MEVRLYVEKQKGGDTSYKWQRRKRDVMRVERVAFLATKIIIWSELGSEREPTD